MLNVVLVDDHEALREGLEVLLERRGVRVLASVGTHEDALAAIDAHRPDVAVVDLELGTQSGVELVRQIRTDPACAKVVIYTGSQDSGTLAEALESGAEGIVLKPGGLSLLVDALRAAARGERPIDPSIAEILTAAREEPQLLTQRQREIFALLADGLSGEEIAAKLDLSSETVRTHVRNAMEKLEARTRTEAVVRALEAGEIRPGGRAA